MRYDDVTRSDRLASALNSLWISMNRLSSFFFSFFSAIKDFVASAKDEEIARPHHTFVRFGRIVDESMGGTSGALFGIFFAAAASEFNDDVYDRSMWIGALERGTKAVMEAGGARPGDRTLVLA